MKKAAIKIEKKNFIDYRERKNNIFIIINTKKITSLLLSLIVELKKLLNKELISLFKIFFFETHDVSKFIEKNVIDFLKIYDKLCRMHSFFNCEKIKKLHQYCISSVERFVKNVFLKKDYN